MLIANTHVCVLISNWYGRVVISLLFKEPGMIKWLRVDSLKFEIEWSGIDSQCLQRSVICLWCATHPSQVLAELDWEWLTLYFKKDYSLRIEVMTNDVIVLRIFYLNDLFGCISFHRNGDLGYILPWVTSFILHSTGWLISCHCCMFPGIANFLSFIKFSSYQCTSDLSVVPKHTFTFARLLNYSWIMTLSDTNEQAAHTL